MENIMRNDEEDENKADEYYECVRDIIMDSANSDNRNPNGPEVGWTTAVIDVATSLFLFQIVTYDVG